MHLQSTVEPIHFPDPEQDTVLHLGLQQLDMHRWMDLDTDFPQFYRHKQQVKADYPDKVYFALPGSKAAQQEFHQLLIDHLNTDQPECRLEHAMAHVFGCDIPTRFQSLWHSSLLAQDDICLLEPADDGFRMTAASVCSPSNWKLEDKIDSHLDAIHEPVPGYADALSQRVNRLFERLKPEAPLLRYNWSIQDSNELFWRADLRNQHDVPPHWQQLARIVRRLSPEQRDYKGLDKWLASLS